jgi:DHA1 family bicyclomycin/chloramphenicol resistance-like MFS transporter
MKKEPSVFVLLLLVSYAAVLAVLFTPALPSIAKHFQISTETTQLTITLFLLGYALGQLPYGPLSNRFGRKKTLYAGLILSIFGSLLCAMAGVIDQFWLLVLGRIASAFGASVGLMMTYTIMSDFYEPRVARQKLAYVMLSFAITPNASAALGGYLTQHFGWQTTFYAEAVYGAILLHLCKQLPETCTQIDPTPLSLKSIVFGYLRCLRNFKLVLCGMLQGCCTSFVYVFAALAPFIAIHTLGLTPGTYGLWNLAAAAGMLVGCFIARKTSHRISPLRSILLGLAILLVGSAAMLLAFLSGNLNVRTLFLPFSLINMGLMFPYINCAIIATSEVKNRASASALLSFLNIAMCVVTVLAIGPINLFPALLPLCFLVLLAVILPIYILLEFILISKN